MKLASEKWTVIQPAAQSLLEQFHNDVSNLWVGETRENSQLQENVDAPPEWYEKAGDLRVKTLQAHIQKMANDYGIPGKVQLSVSSVEPVEIKTEYKVVSP
jgi:hypothetical protein